MNQEILNTDNSEGSRIEKSQEVIVIDKEDSDFEARFLRILQDHGYLTDYRLIQQTGELESQYVLEPIQESAF